MSRFMVSGKRITVVRKNCHCFHGRAVEKQFPNNQKMYFELCDRSSELERKASNFRNPIPLGKRVAIALYKLGSSAEYRTIASLFGVHKSTVCECVLEFCSLLVDNLLKEVITFPSSTAEVSRLIGEFEDIWGFPQCCGAIVGSHIQIKPPKKNATCYHNYRSLYSVILLAVVDAKYKFLYINVGATGRNNDSFVFKNSNLYRFFRQSTIFPPLNRILNNVSVPACLVADSAFPLLPFLQKPYIQRHQMPEYQKHCNSTLSRARVVVENAFGRLKARFRCLQQMDFSIKNTTKIIQACCILNNLCELNSDDVYPIWSVPQALPNQDTEEGDTDEQSVRIREAIANFLAS
ncbi:uncharacterized protein LOC129218640 [Uloborus diversus]|uniref:uncharacterized protein LOC129218640 n=1 Tax=Uloborus diversus TaxID=327109 RepID=UPI002408FF4A|nr:uncharacterized protein LOC129218640 [Uloborus diversus]